MTPPPPPPNNSANATANPNGMGPGGQAPGQPSQGQPPAQGQQGPGAPPQHMQQHPIQHAGPPHPLAHQQHQHHLAHGHPATHGAPMPMPLPPASGPNPGSTPGAGTGPGPSPAAHPFARLGDLLDAARQELETLAHDSHSSLMYRAQRDELEMRACSVSPIGTPPSQPPPPGSLGPLPSYSPYAHSNNGAPPSGPPFGATQLQGSSSRKPSIIDAHLPSSRNSPYANTTNASPVSATNRGAITDQASDAHGAKQADSSDPQLPQSTSSVHPPMTRKEGHGWAATFNPTGSLSPATASQLDVDLLYTLKHASVVCCVQYSPRGEYVATGCNRSAIIWDTSTGNRIATLKDGEVLVGGAQPTGLAGQPPAPSGSVPGDLYIRSLCFSPDARRVASGAEDRIIRVWSFGQDRCGVERRFEGHEADIYALDFASNGYLLVSGSGDRTARVWDTESGRGVHVLVHDDSPSLFALAHNGFDTNASFKFLNIDTSAEKDAGVTSVAFSPCSRYVATGSLDKVARIFDVATGVLLDRLQIHGDSVYCVAFRHDGRQLVTGSLDKHIQVWHLPDYSPLAALASEYSHLQRTSPGSVPQCNASALECATPIRSLKGHKDFVLSLAYSSEGRFVVSGSKDRGVYLWDVETGQPLIVLQGHKNSVISVALAPVPPSISQNQSNPTPEILLASGSGDQRARVWRVKVPAPTPRSGLSNGHILPYAGHSSQDRPRNGSFTTHTSSHGQFGEAPPPPPSATSNRPSPAPPIAPQQQQQQHQQQPGPGEYGSRSSTPMTLPAMRTSPAPHRGPAPAGGNPLAPSPRHNPSVPPQYPGGSGLSREYAPPGGSDSNGSGPAGSSALA
ncbi:WD40-repeat-containing domain protein [Catenaria anguillulae PL171]|uniref:WD40-repeat-containing domain protein n=1 Tax=Catenaria anguillulae PL171 TaxID=765915 RepID=A0A1Y2HAI5_9FUNG|nr:WD40-repeat-containing domain protein [Catenaria anguillulae PL171]